MSPLSDSAAVRAGHRVFLVSHELVSPVLVGRRDELGRLGSLLDQAMDGKPAVALLAGEAGVGKTRLVQEITRVASGRGVRVLSGGCAELGGEGVPFVPLVDVLRTVARSTPVEDLDRCFGAARREFARLLPELDPEAASAPLQEGSAAQLREHVLALITRLTAGRPMLLVVEDLHWADRSTRDLVVFLVQTLRELGVLLLLTYRSDELHRRHPLRQVVTAWERVRSVERIDVERFSRDEVAAQLYAIRRTAPTAQLTDVVFGRSQGNAFLVEEILAAVEGGADPGDISPSLRDVLLARTETVSDAAQRILRTAAAAGPRVADRLLAVVSGMPGHPRPRPPCPPADRSARAPHAADAARTDGPADRPGARGPRPGHRGPLQRQDRECPLHQSQDRQRPRLQHPGQARRLHPHRSRHRRPPQRPPGHRLIRPGSGLGCAQATRRMASTTGSILSWTRLSSRFSQPAQLSRSGKPRASTLVLTSSARAPARSSRVAGSGWPK